MQEKYVHPYELGLPINGISASDCGSGFCLDIVQPAHRKKKL